MLNFLGDSHIQGGEFYFVDQNSWLPARKRAYTTHATEHDIVQSTLSIQPECGDLVMFTSDMRNPHGTFPVRSGNRSSPTLSCTCPLCLFQPVSPHCLSVYLSSTIHSLPLSVTLGVSPVSQAPPSAGMRWRFGLSKLPNCFEFHETFIRMADRGLGVEGRWQIWRCFARCGVGWTGSIQCPQRSTQNWLVATAHFSMRALIGLEGRLIQNW